MSLPSPLALAKPHDANPATVVVLIPVYKHPVLLVEAVDSVIAQVVPAGNPNIKIHTLIVSDGCPFAETRLCGMALQARYPEQITFLEKKNGGPSSARNFGIRYALENFPQMEALYFLDADNRLSPDFITTSFEALQQHPEVTWVYPHINTFGVEWTAEYNIPYSRLLHIAFDNICDTGSMIRASALPSLHFNEDAKSGFEDWDFWLSAVAQGHRGMCVDALGFEYRNRAESRFKEVSRDRNSMLAYLRDRYKNTFSPRKLLELEHEEAPRFARFEADGTSVALFTDPTRTPHHQPLSRFVRDFWAGIAEGDKVHTPEHLVWSHPSILKGLEKMGLLHNLLWLVERILQHQHFVSVSLQYSADSIRSEFKVIEPSTPLTTPIAFLAGRKDIFFEAARDNAFDWLNSMHSEFVGPLTTEITLYAPFDDALLEAEPFALDAMLTSFRAVCDSEFRCASHHRISWRHKQFPHKQKYYQLLRDYLGTGAILPYSHAPAITKSAKTIKADIGFVVPFASFGGSEKVGYAAAQQLRKQGYRTHAFVIGAPKFQIISEFADAFDTINLFGFDTPTLWGGSGRGMGTDFANASDEGVQATLLKGLLCTMDAVVNCQSSPLNAIMGDLKALGISTIYYMHLFDKSRLEREVGHPDLGLLFEHAYELFLLCSHNLRYRLHGLGIPAAKLMTIENAPSFTVTAKRLAAVRKQRSSVKKDAPLTVLYLGRLDAQKGIERVLRILEITSERKLPVQFRMIGASLVDSNLPDNMQQVLRAAHVSMEKPIFDTQELTDVMTEADVIILPSRWEGAPLVILEAQQLGCIPLATDVGAVSEQIHSWEDGVMFASEQDEQVAQEFVDAIAILATDSRKRSQMALAAMDRLAQVSWQQSCEPLIALMDKKFGKKS
jgi:glycosyltransferase involved in cell wall biosynthesis